MRMLIDNLPEKHGSLGSPSINNIKWLNPVYPEYILSVKSCVSQCRLSKSKPDVDLICVNYEIVNQHDATVMTLESNAFFKCRDTYARL
jgi:acyl dehydratase